MWARRQLDQRKREASVLMLQLCARRELARRKFAV
jgi:hypothetical protein